MMRHASSYPIGLLFVATLAAQSPRFDVASVKPSPPADTTPIQRIGP